MARQQDIDLVAAHRPDLALPELAGLGMKGQAIAVAVAVGEDLRQRVVASDEGVVGRHAAVVADAQRLADVIVEGLRLEPQARVILGNAAQAVAIADGDVQCRVGAEQDPPGQVAAGFPGVGDKDFLDVLEAGAAQPTARDRQRIELAFLLAVTQINEPVACEVRMQGN